MLKDRGSMKWTALMLPEHVDLLKQLWEEDNKYNKPIIDEQELELINHYINVSKETQCIIHLSVYNNEHLQDREGIIKNIDQSSKRITLLTSDKEKYSIQLSNIISAQLDSFHNY